MGRVSQLEVGVGSCTHELQISNWLAMRNLHCWQLLLSNDLVATEKQDLVCAVVVVIYIVCKLVRLL
jgi:hypothetical protein